MDHHTRSFPCLTSSGPWEADGAEIFGPDREWIGEACNPDLPDGGAANARLMALSPKLLAALRSLMACVNAVEELRYTSIIRVPSPMLDVLDRLVAEVGG